MYEIAGFKLQYYYPGWVGVGVGAGVGLGLGLGVEIIRLKANSVRLN